MLETAESIAGQSKVKAVRTTDRVPLFGLFGCGRSGTTWLGAILNSHPEVCYRFEPFHRISFAAAKDIFQANGPTIPVTDKHLEQIYKCLLSPHPLIEKPPFFPKRNVWNRGRSMLWHTSKIITPLRILFANLYYPKGQPPLIFKEVNYEKMLPGLLKGTSLKLVYLVRSPQGNVASMLSGQKNNVMPTGRFKVIGELLEEFGSELSERFRDRLDDMTPCEKNALLWRMDVEMGVAAAESSDNALVVVYEDLCQNPLGVARKIFDHFDIPFDDQVKSFIEASTIPDSKARKVYSEGYNDPYFSIFRDPVKSMNGWKKKLSQTDIDQILGIVSDSRVYQDSRSCGFWE